MKNFLQLSALAATLLLVPACGGTKNCADGSCQTYTQDAQATTAPAETTTENKEVVQDEQKSLDQEIAKEEKAEEVAAK